MSQGRRSLDARSVTHRLRDSPNLLEISELCILGFSCAILRRCSLDQTMKAFIGLLIWSSCIFFVPAAPEPPPRPAAAMAAADDTGTGPPPTPSDAIRLRPSAAWLNPPSHMAPAALANRKNHGAIRRDVQSSRKGVRCPLNGRQSDTNNSSEKNGNEMVGLLGRCETFLN